MATNMKNVVTEKWYQNLFATQQEIVWDHFEFEGEELIFGISDMERE